VHPHSRRYYRGAGASLLPPAVLSMINHVSVQRVVDVQASATGRDLGGFTLDIEKAIRSIRELPKATRITLRGQSESMFTAFSRLGVGLILAIALVYLLLVVLFQSFLDPFIILVAVPGALIGILWMLAATGTTLNVESFMGAIMAVGIATSNSILLVSAANGARVEQGLGVLEAAVEAGRTRLRPGLMTALAILLGTVPMALAIGEGGEQNAPQGRGGAHHRALRPRGRRAGARVRGVAEGAGGGTGGAGRAHRAGGGGSPGFGSRRSPRRAAGDALRQGERLRERGAGRARRQGA